MVTCNNCGDVIDNAITVTLSNLSNTESLSFCNRCAKIIRAGFVAKNKSVTLKDNSSTVPSEKKINADNSKSPILRNRVYKSRTSLTMEQKLELLKDHNNGMSYTELCRKYDCCQMSAQRWMKQAKDYLEAKDLCDGEPSPKPIENVSVIDDEVRKKVREDYRNGKDISAIAKDTNYSIARVRHIVSDIAPNVAVPKNDIYATRLRCTDLEYQEFLNIHVDTGKIIALFNAKWRIGDIAKETNVSKDIVRKVLTYNGKLV